MTAHASTPTTSTDDAVALWRLQSRYADVVTRRAWAELRELFLPDAAVHIDMVTQAPMSFAGPDSLGEFIGNAIERFDHFAFVILNAVAEVDADNSDSAHGRIFMCEVRHETATDSWPIAHGMYHDHYLRRDGRWWFSARHYRSMARMGQTVWCSVFRPVRGRSVGAERALSTAPSSAEGGTQDGRRGARPIRDRPDRHRSHGPFPLSRLADRLAS